VLLMFINPVQFPLHEPYFDLTPIKVTHTKIVWRKYLILVQSEGENLQKTKLIAHTPFGAWRVVSTYLRYDPPWCSYSRLLVIPYSCSRVPDYNPFYNLL